MAQDAQRRIIVGIIPVHHGPNKSSGPSPIPAVPDAAIPAVPPDAAPEENRHRGGRHHGDSRRRNRHTRAAVHRRDRRAHDGGEEPYQPRCQRADQQLRQRVSLRPESGRPRADRHRLPHGRVARIREHGDLRDRQTRSLQGRDTQQQHHVHERIPDTRHAGRHRLHDGIHGGVAGHRERGQGGSGRDQRGPRCAGCEDRLVPNHRRHP